MRLSVPAVVMLALALAPAVPAQASHDDAAHSDNIRVVSRDPFNFGTDLAFRGNTMIAGSGQWTDDAGASGIYLYDIAAPQGPKRLSFTNCAGWHADVDFVGNRYAVQSHDDAALNTGCEPGAGKEGVRVFDVSNRSDPSSIGFAETVHGSHNLTAVGDTGLVYVSSYNLGDPSDVDGVSIVDVGADPADPPVRFLEFPDVDSTEQHPDMENRSGDLPTSPGCHDIGLDLDRALAFCAGIEETQIWDISDPRNPAIVSIIRNPAISIHHGARSNGGDVLVLNDEWLGAAGGPTGCLAEEQPSGALWFYDISDPASPRLQSHWAPPKAEQTADFCTSHFYGFFEDRDWLATSWYENGVYVVDFSDPASPSMVAFYDPPGANVWSAYPYQGKIYANSFAPATLTGSDPATAEAGGLWVFEVDGYGRGS